MTTPIDDEMEALENELIGGSEAPAPAAARAAAAAPVTSEALVPRTEPADGRLDVILDIELPLVVRFGRTEMPIKALTHLGPGSVIDLGRSPHEPVEILVSNRVVARGEVVVVSGNYGIRILDVVGPAERMKSLETGR